MSALVQPRTSDNKTPELCSAAPWQDFTVYGVPVRSQIAFAGARPTPSRILPRVELRLAPSSYFDAIRARADFSRFPHSWQDTGELADGSIYVRWPGLFEFHVSSDGCSVFCRRLRPVPDAAFETYLLGQVFSYCLLKQGVETLHATTVEVRGRALSLLGDCGAGKSTLAACFLAAGHRMLSDDLLVLDESGPEPLVQPALPRIKLYPEVAAEFGISTQGAAPMHPSYPKLVIPLDGSAAPAPAPLAALYVLAAPRSASARRITLRRLSQKQAFLHLLAHTFNSRIVAPDRLKRLMEFTHRLAQRLPVRLVSYPRSLPDLPRVRNRILRDFESQAARCATVGGAS